MTANNEKAIEIRNQAIKDSLYLITGDRFPYRATPEQREKIFYVWKNSGMTYKEFVETFCVWVGHADGVSWLDSVFFTKSVEADYTDVDESRYIVTLWDGSKHKVKSYWGGEHHDCNSKVKLFGCWFYC